MAPLGSEREASAPWLRDSKVDAVGLSLERMPQLAGVIDRFVRSVGEALTALCGSGVSAEFVDLAPTSTFEFLHEPAGRIGALIACAEWDAKFLMIFPAGLVDAIVRSAFRVAGEPGEPEGVAETDEAASHPLTELEARLVAQFATILAGALQAAFAPVAGFEIAFAELVEPLDAYALGRRDLPAIVAALTLRMFGGLCRIAVLLPQTALAPIAPKLAAETPSPTATPDPQWARRMEIGVTRARVSLTAILDEFELTLGDIARLGVGDVLNLPGDNRGRVRLKCAERGVFQCRIRERGGHYALEVEDVIAQEPEETSYTLAG